VSMVSGRGKLVSLAGRRSCFLYLVIKSMRLIWCFLWRLRYYGIWARVEIVS
jgi:hypothetical protein